MRSRAYFVRRAWPCSLMSQPMCAWKSPCSIPRTPDPCPSVTCGLCGSPSSSVWAWCLRWSATQLMTGPCTDIDPSTANTYSTGFDVWNERCVSIRWKPIVTPKPVSRYITASTTRSDGPTTLFHSRTIAARNATKGTMTAPTLESLAARVMRWRLDRIQLPSLRS